MDAPYELVATGFQAGVAQAAAADLSKGTGIAMKVVEVHSTPEIYRLFASVVNEFPAGTCVSGNGKPGCASNNDGTLQAYVCQWVLDIYGLETTTAALKHELYHLVASKFQSMGKHSTNTRSLMYSAWNPRKPPGFLAEDRRLLKDHYGV